MSCGPIRWRAGNSIIPPRRAILAHVVAAGYTQRHVLEVLTIVALKPLSNDVNHLAQTPLDPQFASQAWSATGTTVA